MSRSSFALVLALAACLAAPVAQAQWMWRDKAGQVHISDRPPPSEVPDKDIMRRPSGQRAAPAASAAPAAPAASAAASAPLEGRPRVDPELEARRKRAEQEQAAQRKQAEEQAAALRAANCKRAQDQLRTLESGMRMARLNEKGEREVLDDNARAEEAAHARTVAERNCAR
jgi:hypothetical protein